MDVIHKIRQVATTNRRGHQDVPVDNVVIERATRS
jgi:peptidyl-prolyl cis-trans isomerase B (cyclophilin B)